MKVSTLIATGILSFLSFSTALAGDCVMHVKREACPGKEAEAYKKCDGKPECEDKKTAASVIECSKKALEDCANARLDITKLKVITAKFDGKDIDGGKNFCKADRADYNKCK